MTPREKARNEVSPSTCTWLLCGVLATVLLAPIAGIAASHQQASAGNAAYARGAYDEAVTAYREGLIDQPDSLLLRFNLGAALYKLGKYDEAAAAFSAVAASGEEQWIARAAYNLGNTLYRIGESAEASDPKTAVSSYEQALMVYRRAMAADAEDTDAKYGHEFVARKLEELLERQAQQENQQQQQQEQSGEQDQGQEAQQQDQAGDDQQQEQDSRDAEASPEQDSEQSQRQQADARELPSPQPSSAGQSPQAPSEEEQQESLDRQAARAILDSASSEELGPEDITRATGVAGSAIPAKDW